MKGRKYLIGLCMVAGLGAGVSAQAQDKVEVGRVKVVLPQSGWESKPFKVEAVQISKGIFGSLEGRTVIFTYRDGDKPLATLLVHTTWGTSQSLTMSSTCPPSPQLYVHDYTNGGRKFLECVFMGGVFDLNDVLSKGPLRKLAAAKEAGQIELPPGNAGYIVSVDIFRSNGSLVSIEGVLARGFKGLPGVAPRSAVPAGLSPDIAAWADALGDGAQNALRVFRDELPVPKVEFQL